MLDERGHNDDQTSSAEKELQSKAFEQIVQLLLDAGYFRARISNLSEFDKVRRRSYAHIICARVAFGCAHHGASGRLCRVADQGSAPPNPPGSRTRTFLSRRWAACAGASHRAA